jgi:hypothetical protein
MVRRAIAACAAALLLCPAAGRADPPRVHTNQAYIEELGLTSGLDINDPLAVFAMVFASLPASVKVYPTENYYYFHFVHDGMPFHGNLRLDATTRDAGKIAFAYVQGLSQWKLDGGIEKFVVLDGSHGVGVERLERLAYRVSYKGASVVFTLNDLSGVRPPPKAMGTDDRFLGPVFDESGLRFFLVFNARLKAFHFVLDETVPMADTLYAAKGADRVVIGRRTGFAFYRDHRLDRKILIGVNEGNINRNTWFDGPADQLPDNFIEGETLREAIIAADPSAKGQIGRLGHYADGVSRYVISPYMAYKAERDLMRIHACAAARAKRPDYYRCFVVSAEGRIDLPLSQGPPARK